MMFDADKPSRAGIWSWESLWKSRGLLIVSQFSPFWLSPFLKGKIFQTVFQSVTSGCFVILFFRSWTWYLCDRVTVPASHPACHVTSGCIKRMHRFSQSFIACLLKSGQLTICWVIIYYSKFKDLLKKNVKPRNPMVSQQFRGLKLPIWDLGVCLFSDSNLAAGFTLF